MPRRAVEAYVEETLVSGTKITSGSTGILEGYRDSSTLRAQLDVTAATGNLQVFIEDTLDGVTWNPLISFAAKTAVGREVLSYTGPFADRIRVRYEITGTTPSFEFSVRVVSQIPSVA